VNRLFPLLLLFAIAAGGHLSDSLFAQSGTWPKPSSLVPFQLQSQELTPILDFPTDEDPSLIRQIGYEEPIATSSSQELTVLEPEISDGSIDDGFIQTYADPGSETCTECYGWTLLPKSLVYKPYMAGEKESRLSAHIAKIEDDTTVFDGNLGGRFGVLRYGQDSDTWLAEGIQWDVEGSAHVRLDIPEDVDVRSVDFRAGTHVSWSYSNPQLRGRFGYYHISSHLGDEFLMKNPSFQRVNYARDVLILGHSYYVNPNLRVYGEVGWAFYHKVSDPWELQFGVEWAPTAPTGFHGKPFLAINGRLQEELNYGGALTVQTGWAWVGEVPGKTLRVGLHYHNGASSQFSFYNTYEQQIGFGIWYDL